MPSRESRNLLHCFGLVESYSLVCETSREHAGCLYLQRACQNRNGAYIHGVPILRCQNIGAVSYVPWPWPFCNSGSKSSWAYMHAPRKQIKMPWYAHLESNWQGLSSGSMLRKVQILMLLVGDPVSATFNQFLLTSLGLPTHAHHPFLYGISITSTESGNVERTLLQTAGGWTAESAIYCKKLFVTLTYILSFQMRHNSRRHCLSLTLNP